MSLEEMAKQYSEKWNVPIAEATKQIQKFLAKKPGTERAPGPGGMPEEGNIFPDPLGPISKKFQDINQAVLSSAYTRKTLKEMSQPPEEFKTLQEKVEYMEKNIEQVVTLVNTTMKEWKDTLEAQKAEKERQALFDEIDEKVVRPLKEKIGQLEAAKGGDKTALAALSPEKILEAGTKMTEDAQAFLKKQGYNVEIPKALTLAQVEAKIAESLKIKKKEWEEKAGADVEIEKERIRATEEILSGVTDRIFTIFLDPLKDKIHEAIEKGAFARKRA